MIVSYLMLAFMALNTATVSAKDCVQLLVPIRVEAINSKYQTLRVDDNIDAVEWTLDIDKWNAMNATSRITGPLPVKGNFNISAQLCVPHGSSKAKFLQIASHGVTFEKRIWDLPYKPETFSYVDAALSAGYSILTYDRLGVGLSSKPDGYDILQTPLQAEVLKELTSLALSGDLLKVSEVGRSAGVINYKPEKIIHVGHSYGSIVTNLFLGKYGNLSSAALLTGFLINPKAALLKFEAVDLAFAGQDDPVRFGDRGSGYLVFGTLNSFQLDSLKRETLDPEVLRVYNNTLKQTTAVGELLSLTTGVGDIVADFKGPLQMFVGEFDFPFCAGDCKGVFNQTDLRSLYPSAVDVSVYLQKDTGHVLTMSLNATAGYAAMFSYLDQFGL